MISAMDSTSHQQFVLRPNPPSNLTLLSTTGSTVTVSFSAPTAYVNSNPITSPITSYTPNFGTGSGGAGTESSFLISGLATNTIYSIKLNATVKNVKSLQTNDITALTWPGPPTSLAQLSGTTSTVTLSFTAPSGNGVITGYTPSMGSGSGTSSAYTISGFGASNTSYSVSLTATNASGTSGSSSVLSVLTLPSPPTALTFVSATSSSATIQFTAPTGTGTITGYSPSTGTGSGTATAYTISGLASNTSYSLSLTATNSVGTSNSSSSISITTLLSPPTNLYLISSSLTSIIIGFTSPTGTATTVSSYTSNVGSGSGTPASYTITGLSSNTNYSISLTATSSSGTSSLSSSLSVNTIPGPPTGLIFISATYTTVTIRFTAPSGTSTITGYTPSIGTGSGTASSYTISGLSSNTSYTISLTATNSAGISASSSTISVLTSPSAPTGLTLIKVRPSSVTLSFTAPSGTGTITGYTPNIGTGSGTSSSYTITGLSINTSYTITLSASNASGTSPFSSGLSTTTPTGLIISGVVQTGIADGEKYYTFTGNTSITVTNEANVWIMLVGPGSYVSQLPTTFPSSATSNIAYTPGGGGGVYENTNYRLRTGTYTITVGRVETTWNNNSGETAFYKDSDSTFTGLPRFVAGGQSAVATTGASALGGYPGLLDANGSKVTYSNASYSITSSNVNGYIVETRIANSNPNFQGQTKISPNGSGEQDFVLSGKLGGSSYTVIYQSSYATSIGGGGGATGAGGNGYVNFVPPNTVAAITAGVGGSGKVSSITGTSIEYGRGGDGITTTSVFVSGSGTTRTWSYGSSPINTAYGFGGGYNGNSSTYSPPQPGVLIIRDIT